MNNSSFPPPEDKRKNLFSSAYNNTSSDYYYYEGIPTRIPVTGDVVPKEKYLRLLKKFRGMRAQNRINLIRADSLQNSLLRCMNVTTYSHEQIGKAYLKGCKMNCLFFILNIGLFIHFIYKEFQI